MRVLVTRPRAEGEAVAAALTARGHQAVLAPVTTIVPLPVELPAGRIDAVLLTSQHAAAALPAGARDTLTALPAYAVGRSTAAAARRDGFREVRIGTGDAAGLRDLVTLTLPRGAHLLYLAGRVRKAVLSAGLTESGYRLSTVETYDAQPVADWAATVPNGGPGAPFDACLHFSRAAASLAQAGSRNTLREAFDGALHLCLSDDVAEPLRAAGIIRVEVASEPNVSSLLQAIDATLA